MMTRCGQIKCDQCGRFVNLQDLVNGNAMHCLCEPDSDLSRETWDSLCARCNAPIVVPQASD